MQRIAREPTDAEVECACVADNPRFWAWALVNHPKSVEGTRARMRRILRAVFNDPQGKTYDVPREAL